MSIKIIYFYNIKLDIISSYFLNMVACTEFESVNAALRGQCVEPLHQHAICKGEDELLPACTSLHDKSNYRKKLILQVQPLLHLPDP